MLRLVTHRSERRLEDPLSMTHDSFRTDTSPTTQLHIARRHGVIPIRLWRAALS